MSAVLSGRSAAHYGVLALRILMALAFAAAGTAKLVGLPMMVAEFHLVGLGDGFRYFTGSVELVGAALLVWPPTTKYGAPLLLCVVFGALAAQALRIHGDLVHVFVFIALTSVLTWTAWRR